MVRTSGKRGVGLAILGAALLATVGLMAFAMLRMQKIGRPGDHRTPSERFADDAEKLHGLVHPETKTAPELRAFTVQDGTEKVR